MININDFIIEKYYSLFKEFIKSKDDKEFDSFANSNYIKKQEFYKYELLDHAHKTLDIENFDIESGQLINKIIELIEDPNNNLAWNDRQHAKPHNILFEIHKNRSKKNTLEQLLYNFFNNHQDDEIVFNKLVKEIGKKYSVLAYLFFIKDPNKYLPIAPRNFDKAFVKLKIDFATSNKCSWDNYTTFIEILVQIQAFLNTKLDENVSLVDAHSFLWILVKQMEYDGIDLDNQSKSAIDKFNNLPQKDRETVTKSRVGQGKFRLDVIKYWENCAVTHCPEEKLLIASHIKPWNACDPLEAMDPFNGILLSPNIDKAFDKGYISFNDKGSILISKEHSNDLQILGINTNMKLGKLAPKHEKYLQYHRQHIFKKENI